MDIAVKDTRKTDGEDMYDLQVCFSVSLFWVLRLEISEPTIVFHLCSDHLVERRANRNNQDITGNVRLSQTGTIPFFCFSSRHNLCLL